MGLIVLNHAKNGYPVDVLDSLLITALRTAAAMAISVKYLANPNVKMAVFCGSGCQAAFQLRSLQAVLPNLEKCSSIQGTARREKLLPRQYLKN
jgi:alanine dehydrogenase